MLSGPVRAAIQRAVGQTLTQRCDIDTESTEDDIYGAPTHLWVSVQSDVPCRVIQAGQFNTGATNIVGSQETLQEAYKLIVPAGTPVSINDRVTVDGIRYDVVRLELALTDEVYHAALISRRT